jgi:hypothetical protein
LIKLLEHIREVIDCDTVIKAVDWIGAFKNLSPGKLLLFLNWDLQLFSLFFFIILFLLLLFFVIWILLLFLLIICILLLFFLVSNFLLFLFLFLVFSLLRLLLVLSLVIFGSFWILNLDNLDWLQIRNLIQESYAFRVQRHGHLLAFAVLLFNEISDALVQNYVLHFPETEAYLVRLSTVEYGLSEPKVIPMRHNEFKEARCICLHYGCELCYELRVFHLS